MASAVRPPPPKTAVLPRKLKVQGLRESLAARKGNEEPSTVESDLVHSETVATVGSSAAPEDEAPFSSPAVSGEQGGKDMQGKATEGLDQDSRSKGIAPLRLDQKETEADRKESQNEAKSVSCVATKGNASLTDLEKKQQRAERFGVNLQVSEEEKRKLRAARFGTEGNKRAPGNKSESQKRQERATRFGIINDEIKKKARLERFGLDLKQETTPESEKGKLRAARFQTCTNENPVGDIKC